MSRITLGEAQAFAARRGRGMMAHTASKYLEMADGNIELADRIADYYAPTGYERPITVGKVIREFWREHDKLVEET